LRSLRIGLPLFGDDAANAPPAHALARRGLAANVAGYSIYGDYSEPNPPARLIEAVAAGDVDVAVAWGPVAGYFARHAGVPLAVVPVQPASDDGLPFTFAISLGVRRDDAALGAELDHVLERERPAIEALLDEFGVPRVAAPPAAAEGVARAAPGARP
jgi:mxaJ protein